MYVLKSLFYSFIEKNKKKEFQDNIQTNAKTNRRDIFSWVLLVPLEQRV